MKVLIEVDNGPDRKRVIVDEPYLDTVEFDAFCGRIIAFEDEAEFDDPPAMLEMP